RANGSQSKRSFLQLQRYSRIMASLLHRRGRRLATRYVDGRSRPQLSRAAGGLEIHLPARRDHAGRIAGGHERLQIAATSLDERFGPDLQEIASHHLAQPTPAND